MNLMNESVDARKGWLSKQTPISEPYLFKLEVLESIELTETSDQ